MMSYSVAELDANLALVLHDYLWSSNVSNLRATCRSCRQLYVKRWCPMNTVDYLYLERYRRHCGWAGLKEYALKGNLRCWRMAMKDVHFLTWRDETKAYATRLFRNRSFVLAAVAKDGGLFMYSPPELKKDRTFVAEVVRRSSPLALYFADSSLRLDADFVLSLVQFNWRTIQHADTTLLKDKKFMLTAVKSNTATLRFSDIQLFNDKDFVLNVVRLTGPFGLEYATPRLRNDYDVVLTAVQHSGAALCWASPELQRNEIIVRAAVTNDANALCWADPSLRRDRSILLCCVKQHSSSHRRQNIVTA